MKSGKQVWGDEGLVPLSILRVLCSADRKISPTLQKSTEFPEVNNPSKSQEDINIVGIILNISSFYWSITKH